MNFFKKLLLPLVLLCSMALPAVAQDYSSSPNEQPLPNGVDPATLNVRVTIPIVSKSELIPFSAALVFDNNFWRVGGAPRNGPKWVPWTGSAGLGHIANYGWVNPLAFQSGAWHAPFGTYGTGTVCPSSSDGTTPKQFFNYIDPTGIAHPIPGASTRYVGTGTNATCPPVQSANVIITDGSGLTATLVAVNVGTSTVLGKDGTVITPIFLSSGVFGGSSVDVNGNSASVSSAGVFTDSVGVQELTKGTNAQGSDTYTYPTSTGTATVTVNSVPYTLQANFGCGNTQAGPTTGVSLVDNIVLGDGISTYYFTYHSEAAGTVDGRLASIIYPDGSVTSFSNYGTVDCALTYAISSLNVTTFAGTTQYTRDATTLKTTVISPSPALNKTVYTFVKQTAIPHFMFPVQVQTYQGESTLLKTMTLCYQGNQTNCATATAPTLPVVQTDSYVLLAGMSTSSRKTNKFDNYGNITESDVYNFGASTPYLKTVSSNFGYTWNGSTTSPNCTTAIGNGIVDSPCQTQLLTGTGTPLHNVYTQYSPTGHAITIGTLVSGSYVTTSATYNLNGSLASTSDANSQPSTITEGACNNSAPTLITRAISLLAVQLSWDSGCTGAKLTSITDPNGAIVSTAYNDPFWRTTSITDQLLNTANLSYPSPTETESIFNFNNGNSTQDNYTKVFPTGLSSITQSIEAPGSSNWDTYASLFVWDNTGIQTEKQMPCVTVKGTECANVKTITTHDALGRPLVITDGGGGTITYSYLFGSSTYGIKITVGPAPAGEVTKSAQKEYNGLGQLLSVCKLSSATGTTSCGSLGGTGFLTTYTYNVDGTLAAAVRGSQTHSASYDNIGRMLTSVTPEGGTKQFFYDHAPSTPGAACSTLSLPTNYSPVGKLVKTYDANGTTACYSYDQMGRNTGIAYSGTNADGMNRYLVYDAATVHSVVMVNAKLRLAEAYTAATVAGTKVTDEGFSYTARGEISDVYQWSTHSGGWYHTTVTYFSNGALNTLAGVSGGTWTFGLDGKGRPNTALQGTTNEVTGATFNAGNQPLVITLGLGDVDTYTYDANTGRMSSYDFSLKATPVHFTGTPSWNQNGTLRGLTIVDGINAGADSEVCDYGNSSNAGYDEIGRLIRVNCMNGATPVWGQNFAYDGYDNLSKTVPSGQTGTTWTPTYNSANNHYSQGTYDSNGNLLTDTFHTYTWNQDNHPKAITDAGMTMTYDALGRMVEKYDGTSYWQELISPIGPIALMNGQAVSQFRIPLPGGSTALNGINFEHKDWLGSSSLVSSRTRTSTASRLFSPYGEIYNNTGISGDVNFTGDRQDLVAGLYDTPNRELNSSGRWISPDPAGASWNAYQYSTNPLTTTDPSGLVTFIVDGFPVGSGWSISKNGLGFSNLGWSDKEEGYDPNHETEGEMYRYFGIQDGTWSTWKDGAWVPWGPTLTTRDSGLSGTSCSYCKGNDLGSAAHLLAGGIQQAADFVDRHPILLVIPAMVGMRRGNDGPLEEELTDLEGAASGRLQTVYNSFKEFVGSLRAPLEDPYVVGRNVPEMIKGTFYSGHALDTMQQYGIPTSVVEDALTNGTMNFGNQALTFTFTSQNVVVVTNAAGGVITVYPK